MCSLQNNDREFLPGQLQAIDEKWWEMSELEQVLWPAKRVTTDRVECELLLYA